MARRVLRVSLLLVLLLSIIGALTLFAWIRLDHLTEEAKGVVLSSLAETLGREMAVRQVRWKAWGEIILDDFALAREERLREGYALRVRAVHVALSPFALIRRQVQVRGITLEEPEVWVEIDEAGRTNWDSLFNRPRPSLWGWDVRRGSVKGGRVVVEDRRRRVRWEGEGIEARGALRRVPGHLDMDATGKVGNLRVGRGERGMTLRAISVQGRWKDRVLYFSSVKIPLDRSAVEISGQMEARQEGAVALEVGGQLPPRQLHTLWPWMEKLSGLVAVAGRVTGTVSQPTFSGKLTTAGLTLAGISVDSASASVVLTREGLTFNPLAIATYGGSLRGNLKMRFTDEGISVEGRGRGSGLRVARLPGLAAWGVEGIVGGELSISGTGRLPQEFAVEGAIHLEGLGRGSEPSTYPLSPLSRNLISALLADGPWGGDARVRIQGGTVTVSQASLQSPAHRLSGSGRVGPSQQLAFSLEAASERPGKVAELFGVSGLSAQFRANGQVAGTTTAPTVNASIEARDIRWRQGRVNGLRGRVAWDGSGLALEGLVLKAGAGRLEGSGRLQPAKSHEGRWSLGPIRLEGRMVDLPVDEVIAFLPRPVPVRGHLSGTFGLTGTPEKMHGRGELSLQQGEIGGETVDRGEGAWELADNRLQILRLVLRGPGGRISGEGVVERSGQWRGTLRLAELELANISILRQRLPELGGKGEGVLRGRGSWEHPALTGQFRFDRIRYRRADLGAVDGQLDLTDRDFRIALTSTPLGWNVQGTGRVQGSVPVDLVVTARETPLGRLLGLWSEAAGRPLPDREVVGTVAGSLAITGPLLEPRSLTASAVLDPFRLSLEGQSWRNEGPLRLHFADGRVTLDAVALRSEMGRLTAQGSLDPGRSWDLGFKGTLELASLPWGRAVPILARVQGQAAVDMTVRGTWPAPGLEGEARFTDATVRMAGMDEAVNVRRGVLRFRKDRIVVESLEASTGRGRLEASGELRLVGFRPEEFSFRLSLSGQALRPIEISRVLRQSGMASPPDLAALEASPFWRDLSVRLVGDLKLHGRVGVSNGIRAEGSLRELGLESQGIVLTSRGPVRWRFDGHALSLQSLTLEGPETRAILSGWIDVDRQMDLSVAGTLGLDLLARRFPQWFREGRGTARVQVRLRGKAREPSLEGTLTVEGATLAFRRVPQTLHLTTARIEFGGAIVRVVEVEGKWGEGPVSLRGTVGLGPEFRPATVDLSFEGHNLRFRVPDVAHGTFDATLTARGKIPGPLIQGEVVLRRATYTKEVRPAVVQGNTALTQTVSRIPESLRGLRFEVQFRSPGDLWIRNNVANLEIRANLTLRGTAEAPIVLGHAELVQGSWIYRDRPFQLVSGSFDFLTPRRINPQISVTAESRVREVKLLLTVTGTLDNLAFQLGSDPPLPREQVNNLVATGAAGLVGGDILGPLLGEAGKIAKLDVFQVEPSLDARQKASVAMGKRFGDRLEVTLTRTIGSDPGQRVLVEYQIFDFLSLVATQNERGITGLDLRFSYPFR